MKTLDNIEKTNTLEDYRVQLKSCHEEIKLLKSLLETKETENSLLKQQLDKKTEELKQSAKFLAQTQNVTLTRQIDKLQNHVDQLLEANQKLRDECTEYRGRIVSLLAEKQADEKRRQVVEPEEPSEKDIVPPATRVYISTLKEKIEKLGKNALRQELLLKKALNRVPFSKQSEVYDDNVLE